MRRILLPVLVMLLAGCANERFAQETIKLYYPSSGVTADNFAPTRGEIDTLRFAENSGTLNEFIKPLNLKEVDLPGGSLTIVKAFGPWQFPSEDFISPYERDLIINFARKVAEREAPRNAGKRLKPVNLIFWKDENSPQKFGIYVRYAKS